MNDDAVDIRNISILLETDAALHIETEEGDQHWIPLSQVESIHRSKNVNGDWIVIKEWIAKKKGLI